jgi:dTDP-4-dehydrorhamnose reductase
MKIAIVGASGFIGRNLYSFLKAKKVPVLGTCFNGTYEDCVTFNLLTDNFSIFNECTHVLIGAGITKIDDCARFKEKAYAVNVTKTIELIGYLGTHGIAPIFLSSDQVFDGEKGNYREEDSVNPVNFYGKYKVIVEEHIRTTLQKYLILRLSKTFSTDLRQESWYTDIVTQLKKGIVIKAATDKIYNPTDIRFVCQGIYFAIKEGLTSLYHLAQPHIMSSYDFVVATAKEYGFPDSLVEPVSFSSYAMLEKRALNSSLNVDKIHRKLGA